MLFFGKRGGKVVGHNKVCTDTDFQDSGQYHDTFPSSEFIRVCSQREGAVYPWGADFHSIPDLASATGPFTLAQSLPLPSIYLSPN